MTCNGVSTPSKPIKPTNHMQWCIQGGAAGTLAPLLVKVATIVNDH